MLCCPTAGQKSSPISRNPLGVGPAPCNHYAYNFFYSIVFVIIIKHLNLISQVFNVSVIYFCGVNKMLFLIELATEPYLVILSSHDTFLTLTSTKLFLT